MWRPGLCDSVFSGAALARARLSVDSQAVGRDAASVSWLLSLCCLRSWAERPLLPSSPLNSSIERALPSPRDTKSAGTWAQTLQPGTVICWPNFTDRGHRGVGPVPGRNRGVGALCYLRQGNPQGALLFPSLQVEEQPPSTPVPLTANVAPLMSWFPPKTGTQVSHSPLTKPLGNQVTCVNFCPRPYMEPGGRGARTGSPQGA